jgi:UDP-N-acetylglucosamine 1-carboxyvinyltransferase
MAASALGDSEISGYAKEPHVLAVVDFLRAAGAKIQLENDKILVHPAPLHPTEFTVIGDMIEAGTYLTAAMITGGNITVSGIDFRELSSFLNIAEELGFTPEILPLISFENEEKSAVFTSKKLLSSIRIDSKKRKFSGNKISVSAAPYPAFPTDLQPIIAPILAKESGGQIRDFVFPERFGYLENLATFGIKSRVVDKCAKIEKSRLKSGSAIAPDLRGGMACLLAALGANGYSEIRSAQLILRGYDRLAEKLTSLGADVKTIKM